MTNRRPDVVPSGTLTVTGTEFAALHSPGDRVPSIEAVPEAARIPSTFARSDPEMSPATAWNVTPPRAKPSASPVEETVAICASLLLHVTDVFPGIAVVLENRSFATMLSCCAPPTRTEAGVDIDRVAAGPATAVALNDTDGAPEAVAVTDCAPASGPRPHWTDATPPAPVDTEAAEREPDPTAGSKSTRTPSSGAPSVAIARTAMESGSA